jgi:uncharacterized protein (DUF983 family)
MMRKPGTAATLVGFDRWKHALTNGVRRRCPRCGEGRSLSGYVAPVPRCADCGLDLEKLRADDGPAYFTILLVGHIVIPGMLLLEQMAHPAIWIHAVIWPPLTLALSLIFLPLIKGMMIGVNWAVGFDADRMP